MEKLQPVTEITQQTRDRLVNYVSRIVGDRELAEDITQNTLLRALAKEKQFQGRCSYHTWLCVIAKSLCVNYFRRNREYATIEDAATIPCAMGTAVDPLLDVQLHSAIKSLSPKLQEIIDLQYFQDLTLSEIAVRLGIPVNTAKARAHQAKLRLRQRMVN